MNRILKQIQNKLIFSKVYLTLFCYFVIISNSIAELDVFYDYSVFRYNNDSTIVEFYYSFIDTDVKYLQTNKNVVEAKLSFNLNLSNRLTKKNVYFDKWDYPIRKKESDTNNLFSFLGVRKAILEPGDYLAEFVVMDINNQQYKYSDTLAIKINNFVEGTKPQISGILLANRIERADNLTFTWDEMFRKDNLYILPNPSQEYQSITPDLQFYFEVYNHDSSKPQNIAVSILDANKREMTRSLLKLTSQNKSFGKNLTLPLDLLPTGVYYLVLDLLSENDNSLDVSSKKFFYINAQMKPMLSMYFTEDQIFEQSEFITMDEATLNLEYRKARIIGTNEEMAQWDNLKDLTAKQRFLYRFWRNRDTNPETIANETKIAFDERVKYANKHFAITKEKEGWSTDRGKILLKYGEPTMITNQEEIGLKKSYQIWQYDEIQGGVIFVFVDQVGIGHYILVHSTAYGEINNPNWHNQYILKQKNFDR